jgi:hypothetical protein
MWKNTRSVLTTLSAGADKALYGLEIYDRAGFLHGAT